MKDLPEGVTESFTRACSTCGGTVHVVGGDTQPHACWSQPKERSHTVNLPKNLFVTADWQEEDNTWALVAHDPQPWSPSVAQIPLGSVIDGWFKPVATEVLLPPAVVRAIATLIEKVHPSGR